MSVKKGSKMKFLTITYDSKTGEEKTFEFETYREAFEFVCRKDVYKIYEMREERNIYLKK